MLTTDAVCRLCDLRDYVLRTWISRGVLRPAERGGPGRGKAHRFTLPQAVGLCVAAAQTRTVRGASHAYVARVVGAFAAVTPAWLEAEFAAGRTCLLDVRHDRLVLSAPEQPDQPDVRAAYRRAIRLLATRGRPASRPVTTAFSGSPTTRSRTR